MTKVLWIINQYGSLPSTGIGGRHRHLARELTNLGFKVSLISARWSHHVRDQEAADCAPDLEEYEGFRFLRIATIKYMHAHDKKRVLSWFIFAWRIRRLGILLREKPNVIIYSSPSLIAYLSAYRLSKKLNAKLIFEVRDIWPLSLTQLGGFSDKHLFIRFLQSIEKFAYKSSDFVISNLEGAINHMKEKGLTEDKFAWIPNGFSMHELENAGHSIEAITDSIKNQPFSITYTGAIGEANCLDTLIGAAVLIKNKKQVHFNIVGQGRLLGELISKADRLELNNVHFWGVVPKNSIQSILRVSSACVILQKEMKLYEYGVAANKLFDYLFAKRPIINAYSGKYDIVSRYRAGITVPAENPISLAGAIAELADLSPDQLSAMGANGKSSVEENHEYHRIAAKLNSILLRVLSGK